ncbi:hypothetical protein KIW84_074753 [Lathyrus oleraceus]|uniref:Uncharacterized protein n=1 Tax=Pisum sativum TaxID=3888 RepID=A0A9D4VT49_PEA|nr:hypothetical protein KIW84_074753 [Pisum sativum]
MYTGTQLWSSIKPTGKWCYAGTTYPELTYLGQRRMKKAFGQKVCPREYRVVELVLKRFLPPNTDHMGKWTPNYEGPYVVERIFSEGALMLTTTDGEDCPSPINSDAVTGTGCQVMNPHPQAVDKVSPQQSMFPNRVDSIQTVYPHLRTISKFISPAKVVSYDISPGSVFPTDSPHRASPNQVSIVDTPPARSTFQAANLFLVDHWSRQTDHSPQSIQGLIQRSVPYRSLLPQADFFLHHA